MEDKEIWNMRTHTAIFSSSGMSCWNWSQCVHPTSSIASISRKRVSWDDTLLRSEKRLWGGVWKRAIKSGEKCVDGFPLEVALNLNRTLFNTSCETEICHIFLLRFDSTCRDKNESHIYASFLDTRPPLASHLPRLSSAMTASSPHHISLISSLPMCHAVSFPDTHLDTHTTNAPFPSWMEAHYSALTQMCELHHH